MHTRIENFVIDPVDVWHHETVAQSVSLQYCLIILWIFCKNQACQQVGHQFTESLMEAFSAVATILG